MACTTGCRALTIRSLFPTQGQGSSGGGEAVNRTNVLVNEDITPPWAATVVSSNPCLRPDTHISCPCLLLTAWVLTLIPFLIGPLELSDVSWALQLGHFLEGEFDKSALLALLCKIKPLSLGPTG